MKLKIQPDIQKAKALVEMANISFQRLKETSLYKYSTNTLTDCYDIIHKLLEALSLIDGIKIKGEGAHQELIDHIFRKNNLKEGDRVFLQEIRDIRNRISYEGFMIKEEYIKNNFERITKIIEELKLIYTKSVG